MKQMSRWGVGPRFTLFSMIYAIPSIVLTLCMPDIFVIKFIPIRIAFLLGLSLSLIGIVFYIAAIKSVMKAFTEKRLYTKGVFAICRHPVYASWTFFLAPAIIVFLRSSIGLGAMPLMYFLLLLLTKEEDDYLEKTFGEQYFDYKRKVPAILPLGFLIKK